MLHRYINLKKGQITFELCLNGKKTFQTKTIFTHHFSFNFNCLVKINHFISLLTLSSYQDIENHHPFLNCHTWALLSNMNYLQFCEHINYWITKINDHTYIIWFESRHFISSVIHFKHFCERKCDKHWNGYPVFELKNT